MTEMSSVARRIATDGTLLVTLMEELAALGSVVEESIMNDVTDPEGPDASDAAQYFLTLLTLNMCPDSFKVGLADKGTDANPQTDRKCRICGCTDIFACTEPDGSPCCWMDDDLCSGCTDLQGTAGRWAKRAFPADVVANPIERGSRCLEETAEFCQHLNMPVERQHAIIDYVNSRPREEDPRREVGGMMVTLAVACDALDIDMMAAAEAELAQCHEKIDAIRAKQTGKPAAICFHGAGE